MQREPASLPERVGQNHNDTVTQTRTGVVSHGEGEQGASAPG